MKKTKLKNLFLSLAIITSVFFENIVFAGEIKYDPESESLIIMKNGTTLHANILEKKLGVLLIYTKDLGKIIIDIENVKEIKFITNQKDKVENLEKEDKENLENNWFNNQNDTSLFYMPTARIKKTGMGYFKFGTNKSLFTDTNRYVFIDTNYAITDNFSIGLTGDGMNFDGIIYPKFGFEITKGLNFAGSLGVGNDRGLLLASYGVVTYGNVDNNITIGLLHIINAFNSNIVLVGGMYRISKYASIIMETRFTPSTYDYTSSLGMRFFVRNISLDLGGSMRFKYLNNFYSTIELPSVIINGAYSF